MKKTSYCETAHSLSCSVNVDCILQNIDDVVFKKTLKWGPASINSLGMGSLCLHMQAQLL